MFNKYGYIYFASLHYINVLIVIVLDEESFLVRFISRWKT